VISTKTRDGKKKINQYIVMKMIGKGNFGKVKLVYNTDENNKQYAMKSIPKKNKIKGIIHCTKLFNSCSAFTRIARHRHSMAT
jgi:serine/threonine protein kinase